MKRRFGICLLALVFIATMAAGCNGEGSGGGDATRAEREHGSPSLHSIADVDDAMDVVCDYFEKNMDGCTLTRLWYDENSVYELEQSESTHNYNGRETIILYSDFKVGRNGPELGFSANENVEGWQWFLTKKLSGKWQLENYGF